MIDLLASTACGAGENDLQVIMMCELPSNAVIADQFLDHFDGFSIGSNDMTQLTLGLDRDSALVAAGFDERDPAVKFMLSAAIRACKARGKYVGICGQGPSDHPDLAEWLLDEGIDSMSLNPDTVVDTWVRLGKLTAAATLIRAEPDGVAARIRLGSGAWMTSAWPPNSYAKRGCWPATMLADGLKTEYKTSVSDVVSAADHAAEELVTDRLAEQPAATTDWSARRVRASPATAAPGTSTRSTGRTTSSPACPTGAPRSAWPTRTARWSARSTIPPLDELWVGGRDHPTTLNGVPVAGWPTGRWPRSRSRPTSIPGTWPTGPGSRPGSR